MVFAESRDQLALYGASGSLTSPETSPWADRLCLALLARTTRARGTVLDIVAQFVGGRDLHLGRWRDVQENIWSYVRFTADIDPEYTDKPMRIHIIATQDDGASMYIRKIEECDAEEKHSTIVVKKTVSMPAVFSGKSEDIKAFAQELSGKCINGGILSKKNGQCVCPPGFAGSYCAEGCGANKFGDDCGGKCSSFTRGCQGLALCKHEVGCDCAPGFRGRFCSDGCAQGQYGFGCRQSCGRCQDGAPCDPFTGVCPAGCEAGFFGELCRFKYKYLSTAPVVYTHGPHDLEVVFKKDLTLGRGLPRFYKIQYRLSGEKQWTSRQTRRLQENEDIVTANITGLTTWKYYDVRAVLVDLDLNSYEGEDVPYITVRTSCVVPEEVEYYIHSSDVQSNSFQVTWLYEPREDWCPLQHFEVWLRDSWRWVVYARTSDTSANFTGLLAGRRHRARVRAVTVQGPARFSRTVLVTTSDQVPEMVLNLHQSIAKGRTIEIKWKEPRFTAGIIKHYIVIYKCKQLVACPDEDCSHSAGQLTVRTTHAELQKLIPHAQYYL
ncbi:tenascin-R-like [Bacillus rossius redtenbacheri]|uniref:tenascin-R-like n=1 Tax=Bacillus rossius redtenbacheri TaxID=93214 RepID=UPI002FDE3DCB